jgi:energy-coupling factor transporter transmembrane protein EcfT
VDRHGGAGSLTGLHPAFRILLLAALAAMLFRYSLAALALAQAVLLATVAAGGRTQLASLWRSLRRIRWLLLSIAVIYLWIAPEPSVDGRPWYLPSIGDLDLALRRAGVLVVLVTAVELLKHRTPPRWTAAGLVQLLAPLSMAGLDTRRFARRVALTLDAVPETAARVARAAPERPVGRGLSGWGEAAARLIREIETRAAVPDEASLPVAGRPAARDWLWLVAGIGAVWMLGRL